MKRKIQSFHISNVLQRHIQKYKGLTGKLEKEIFEASGHTIDKRKLDRIADPNDHQAVMKKIDIEAIERILSPQESFFNNPFLIYKKDLLDIFSQDSKMDVFIPMIFSGGENHQVANRWNIRTFQTISDSPWLNHMKVHFRDVIHRTAKDRADIKEITERQWYKSLYDESDHPRISLSSSFANLATEVILSKIFDIQEDYFNPKVAKNLPFKLHYPNEEWDRKHINNSAFQIDEETIKNRYPDQYEKLVLPETITIEKETLKTRRAIVIDGQVLASNRRSEINHLDEVINYGLLILSRTTPYDKTKNGRILGTILPTYATTTLAIAERIFSHGLKAKLPDYHPEKKTALIIPFKVTVGIRQDMRDFFFKYKYDNPDKSIDDYTIDWQEIKRIEILSINTWQKKNEHWEITDKQELPKEMNPLSCLLS